MFAVPIGGANVPMTTFPQRFAALLIVCLGIRICYSLPPLAHGIDDYDVLSYPAWSSVESRRADAHLEVAFNALDLKFHINLSLDSPRPILQDVEGHLLSGGEKRPLTEEDLDHQYVSGFDANMAGSTIIGYIRRGLFFGQIIHPENAVFYVERAEAHGIVSDDFHSVIYESSSALHVHGDYAAPLVSSHYYSPLLHRWKRDFPSNSWMKRVCTVHAVADHLFFEDVGNGNVADTIDAMAQHIRTTNAALVQTDFDFDGLPDQVYNVMIVAFVSNGRRLSPLLTEVTLMHELGHAMGASHDTSACHDSDDPSGYYIMYAKSTPGYMRNNRMFSSCSRHQIANVMRHRADIQRCLKHVNQSYCGNGIVESGEECDCGSAKDCEAIDKCCYPREHPLGGCTVQRDKGYQCSPNKGPCCTDQCQFKPSTTLCGMRSDCKQQSVCSGDSLHCPPSQPHRDMRRCANGGAVCVEGECIGSPCLLLKDIGWSVCECRSTGTSCHVCCEKNGICVDTFSGHADFVTANISSLLHPSNTPCHHYEGYCSSEGVCKGVDFDDYTEAVGKVFHHVFAGMKALLNFWYLVLFSLMLGPLAFYSWKLASLSSTDIHQRYEAFKVRVSEDFTAPEQPPERNKARSPRRVSQSTHAL
ncbi:disintegrin and metalloproteinase domain-containing protein 10-like isoform X2 [Sycon ciliatum]|uniref:disintegrin and metalloproteinase domain-containing protein 10-like isoform X2 n=1 Tax=Sycon ciliatum TaxID=27933 RepID=UPI0031F6073C